MKKIILSVFALLFFFAIPVYSIPLDECIRIAIKNRAKIKQSEYEIKSAKENERAARAEFFPSLDLSYAIDWSHVKGSYDIGRYGDFKGYEGLGGLSIPERFTYDETDTYSSFSISLSYNLFRGFKDYRALKAAKYNTQAKEFLLSAAVADISFEVKRAYIKALRAKNKVDVFEDALRLLKKQESDAELKYKVGLITKRELLKVQVELASAKQDLLAARANLKKALDTLKRVMGVSEDEIIELEEVDLSPFDVEHFDELKRRLLGSRSEIKYYENMIVSLNEERKSKKGSYFPEIDLTLSYRKFGDDYFLKSSNEGLDYETRAMLIAKWNLFRGLKDYARVKEALYKRIALEKELEEVKRDLVLQLRHAIEDYIVAKNRLNVAKEALKEAKEHYRVTYEAFKNGLADTTDLLDARYFLTRAKNQHLDAHYDIQLAIATLQRVLEIKN